MKMKQIGYRFLIFSFPLLFGIVLLTAGCGEMDFVDPNGPSLEQTTIQTLVTGIEASMRNEYAIYLRDVSVIGREAYYFEPADPRYTGTLMGKDGTQIDPSGFILNRPWSARYRVIRNCNFLIAKGNKGASGFAKTIKAYQFLLNVNLTWENGIRINVDGDTPGPFVNKDEALTFISQLLDDAKSDLENAGSKFSFELSSGFADFNTPKEFIKFNRALKARVAIYQKDYNAALTALGESFMDKSAPLTKGAYFVYGSGVGDQLNPIYEVPNASSIKFMVHPSFINDAEAGDTRVAKKTFKRDAPTTFDGLTSQYAQTVSQSSTDPFPIIRNEELILLHAEANVGLGNYAEAESDVNFIRNAAGLGNVSLNANNALDEVLKQKRYSLFLEGYRWIDMRLYDKLNELPIDRPGDVVHKQMPRPSTEI
jgi:hypothetical protein